MIELTFNELEIISESLHAKWERLKETEHQVYSYAVRGLINKITKETHETITKLPKCNHIVGYRHGMNDALLIQSDEARDLEPSTFFTFCPKCGEKL